VQRAPGRWQHPPGAALWRLCRAASSCCPTTNLTMRPTLPRLPLRRALALLALQAALLGAVGSAEVEVDGDLMRSIDDTVKSLDSNVSLKAGKAAAAEAKELAGLFAQIEVYYVRKRDAQHAVELSRKSMELAAQVAQAVEAEDFDTAADAVSGFIRACKACHNIYKKD
jgi:hypothetical protein